MLEFLSSFFDKFHSLILVSLTNVSYVFCILSLCRIPNHIGSIFDCNSSSLKKILLKKQKNDSFLFIYTKKQKHYWVTSWETRNFLINCILFQKSTSEVLNATTDIVPKYIYDNFLTCAEGLKQHEMLTHDK